MKIKGKQQIEFEGSKKRQRGVEIKLELGSLCFRHTLNSLSAIQEVVQIHYSFFMHAMQTCDCATTTVQITCISGKSNDAELTIPVPRVCRILFP
jgi:hypothetical protein